jgi:hypothetical protein
VTIVTASILRFRRQTAGHGLTANDLEILTLGAEYMLGLWRLDAATGNDGSDVPKVWLRSQSEERAMFPDIGFNRVAGIVWVTTKHSGDRLGTPYATVDAAIHLLCSIMLPDEAIGASQHH